MQVPTPGAVALPMNTFLPLETPESVIAILSQISIFGGVTETQQNAIFARLETGLFRQGEFVFRKGDEPSHIYIVKSGIIELFFPDDDGVMIEKKKLGVGECFGQVALMSIHSHTISAVALEDSEIIVLSRRAMQQFLRDDIGLFALLMMNIARELARRLQFTDEMLLRSLHQRGDGKGLDIISGP